MLGYIFIPLLYLGFILATNSSKGWTVKNDDGLLFVPIGMIILIISLLIISIYIIRLLSAIKHKNHTNILFGFLYLFGVVLYLTTWLFW